MPMIAVVKDVPHRPIPVTQIGSLGEPVRVSSTGGLDVATMLFSNAASVDTWLTTSHVKKI
jgi:hypothetical protein